MRIKKLWLATIAALWCSLTVNAQEEFEVDDIFYIQTSSGTVEVFDYWGSEDVVVIPSTVEFAMSMFEEPTIYRVTSIGEHAFFSRDNLTSITIPENVTYIGEMAFYDCINLKTVINCSDLNIQKGSNDYGYVGAYADRVIKSDEVINGYAFDGNVLVAYLGNDTELNLPYNYRGGVYQIGEYAFYGRSNLTSVVIPSSVTSIGESAFEGCGGELTVNCNIPSGAFRLSNFEKVVIGEGVTSIGESAFDGCSNIASIISFATVPPTIEGSDAFPDVDKSIPVYVPNSEYSNADGWKEFTNFRFESPTFRQGRCGSDLTWRLTYDGELIIEGTGEMEGYHYPDSGTPSWLIHLPPWNEYGVERVTINEGVTSIGYYAFFRCSLTSITLPNSLTDIPYRAFEYSVIKTIINYSALNIQKGSVDYGYVGYYADKVINVDEFIGDYAFRTIDGVHYVTGYIGNDTELVLPEDYQGDDYVIAESAFQGYEDIVSVKIPQTVGSIGKSAFADCVNLASVEMARGVMSIEDNAFENCTSLSSVVIPQNMRIIGNRAFAGCSSLASIEFKEGVKSFGNNAFENCTALTEIVIPESLTAIGAGAFKNCSGIASIIVGKEVESIGEGAFEGCTAVKTLIVKGSVMPTVPSSALTTIVLYSPVPLETEEFANKVYRNATLYVRNASLARYQSADVWENFWTIKGFDHMQEVTITLDQTEVTLTEGESMTLTVTVTPEFMSEMAVTWSTSDALVVTVDEEGAITAHATGTATIAAMVGGMTATCKVTVTGGTTGVENSEIRNEKSEIIYDLQGRRVLDVENIKGGLYIVNGRKVLVK